MATQSSVLAWENSVDRRLMDYSPQGLQRVGHD